MLSYGTFSIPNPLSSIQHRLGQQLRFLLQDARWEGLAKRHGSGVAWFVGETLGLVGDLQTYFEPFRNVQRR
jgi:hypothetical protein